MKLRLLKKEDLPTRVEWMNNPTVYPNMHFTPPISLERTMGWYERNQISSSRYDFVFTDDSGEMVAMGGLTGIDNRLGKAEFYIFVNPARQREGIGFRATYLLCKYGFDVLKLNKIYLLANSDNIGARKTYEKVGFKLEGVLRNEVKGKNGYEDRLYYGLFQDEMDKNLLPLDFAG